jgi:hypothetical protein
MVYYDDNTDGGNVMRKLFGLLPAMTFSVLALSACGYSVTDTAKAVAGSVGGDFTDGIAISPASAPTAAFSKLSLMGPDDVIFTAGEKFTIRATGDAETVKKLRYEITGDGIKVGRIKEKWYGDQGSATIRITGPSLSSVTLAGSGDIDADRVEADDVKFSLAGSGNIVVQNVRAKSAAVSLAGSGNIDLAGNTDSLKITIAGSGDVNTGKLTATDAKISVAGSGNVTANATRAVDANIVGSGDVSVTGGATCKSNKMGAGKLRCS